MRGVWRYFCVWRRKKEWISRVLNTDQITCDQSFTFIEIGCKIAFEAAIVICVLQCTLVPFGVTGEFKIADSVQVNIIIISQDIMEHHIMTVMYVISRDAFTLLSIVDTAISFI